MPCKFVEVMPGYRGVLTTGGEAPSCLGFVDGGSSSGPMLQIAPLGPLGSSQAAYCGYNPSALTAGQSPSVVFQIELQDGLYSTITSNFSLASANTSRLAMPVSVLAVAQQASRPSHLVRVNYIQPLALSMA